MMAPKPMEEAVDVSETPISPTPLGRRHRRSRTVVSREDIVRFRAEVLGIPPDSSANKEVEEQVEEPDEGEEKFKELELAFSSYASMSLGGTNGNNSINTNLNTNTNTNPNPNAGAGLFTNFFENNTLPNSNMTSLPRPSPPSSAPGQNGAPGGMTGINAAMTMNAGHQMDLNHLYEMVLELSEVLKNNRDMTKGIINSAEEIMVCFPFSLLIAKLLRIYRQIWCI